MTPVFRFAPSPNGRLHLGHAYSAQLNAALARRLGGRLLLRLEDIDTVRCTPELAAHCLDDLAWLGLRWEMPVRVQSHHWQDYQQALEALDRRGLLYPCFCTRRTIREVEHAFDPDGAPLYPGTCARLSPAEAEARILRGEPHSLRLRMARALDLAALPLGYTRFDAATLSTDFIAAHPERWGDVVVARKDIPSSYHLSVVVDDALQGVTHVVRGADLEATTCLHVLLQTLLGLPTPLYHHHDLLTEAPGLKRSKSRGSESLADLRARGLTPHDIQALLEAALAPETPPPPPAGG